MFQWFHHISHIGFGRIVKQRRQSQGRRNEVGNDQAVLGDRVKMPRLPVEAALVRQTMGNVLDVDLIGRRSQRIELLAGKGRDIKAMGAECHGLSLFFIIISLRRLSR